MIQIVDSRFPYDGAEIMPKPARNGRSRRHAYCMNIVACLEAE